MGLVCSKIFYVGGHKPEMDENWDDISMLP